MPTLIDQIEIIDAAGNYSFKSLDPDRGLTTIGRNQSNDIAIDNEGVANVHAIIYHRSKPHRVMLFADEGARVGDEALLPNQPHDLADGDTIYLNGHLLVYLEGVPESSISRGPSSSSGTSYNGAGSALATGSQDELPITQASPAVLATMGKASLLLTSNRAVVEVDHSAVIRASITNHVLPADNSANPNAGSAPFQVNIVRANGGAWGGAFVNKINTPLVTLRPGESRTVEIEVRMGRPGRYPLQVTAQAPDLGTEVMTADFVLVVYPHDVEDKPGPGKTTNVIMTMEERERVAEPGQLAQFALALTNTGRLEAQFQIFAEPLHAEDWNPNWTKRVTPEIVHLHSGESATALITIDVTGVSGSVAGVYPFLVQMRSSAYPTSVCGLVARLKIEPSNTFSVDGPVPVVQSLRYRDTATHTRFRIHNYSNAPLNFVVVGTDRAGECDFAFHREDELPQSSPAQYLLNAGETYELVTDITPRLQTRKFVAPNNRTLDFTLTTTMVCDPPQAPLPVLGQVIVEPRFTTRVAFLLVLLLLVGFVSGFVLLFWPKALQLEATRVGTGVDALGAKTGMRVCSFGDHVGEVFADPKPCKDRTMRFIDIKGVGVSETLQINGGDAVEFTWNSWMAGTTRLEPFDGALNAPGSHYTTQPPVNTRVVRLRTDNFLTRLIPEGGALYGALDGLFPTSLTVTLQVEPLLLTGTFRLAGMSQTVPLNSDVRVEWGNVTNTLMSRIVRSDGAVVEPIAAADVGQGNRSLPRFNTPGTQVITLELSNPQFATEPVSLTQNFTVVLPLPKIERFEVNSQDVSGGTSLRFPWRTSNAVSVTLTADIAGEAVALEPNTAKESEGAFENVISATVAKLGITSPTIVRYTLTAYNADNVTDTSSLLVSWKPGPSALSNLGTGTKGCDGSIDSTLFFSTSLGTTITTSVEFGSSVFNNLFLHWKVASDPTGLYPDAISISGAGVAGASGFNVISGGSNAGSVRLSPPSVGTFTYILTVKRQGIDQEQSCQRELTVTAPPPPGPKILYFVAINQNTLQQIGGEQVEATTPVILKWATEDASAVTLANYGPQPLTDQSPVITVTNGNKSFVLTATNAVGQQVLASISINIRPRKVIAARDVRGVVAADGLTLTLTWAHDNPGDLLRFRVKTLPDFKNLPVPGNPVTATATSFDYSLLNIENGNKCGREYTVVVTFINDSGREEEGSPSTNNWITAPCEPDPQSVTPTPSPAPIVESVPATTDLSTSVPAADAPTATPESTAIP